MCKSVELFDILVIGSCIGQFFVQFSAFSRCDKVFIEEFRVVLGEISHGVFLYLLSALSRFMLLQML